MAHAARYSQHSPPRGVITRASTRRVVSGSANVGMALELIRCKACEGIRVADVVSAMGISRRAAEMHFRLEVGRSIHEEIDEVRFAHVLANLRDSNKPISALADLCGFSSGSALRKAFGLRMGMPMRAWRKQQPDAQK